MRKKNWRGRGRGRATVKQPSPPLALKGLPHLQKSFVQSSISAAGDLPDASLEETDMNASYTEVCGNVSLKNFQAYNDTVQLKQEETTLNYSEEKMAVYCECSDSVNKLEDSNKASIKPMKINSKEPDSITSMKIDSKVLDTISPVEPNHSEISDNVSNNNEVVEIQNDNHFYATIVNEAKRPEIIANDSQQKENPMNIKTSKILDKTSNVINSYTTVVMENVTDAASPPVIIGPSEPPKEFFESVKQHQSESDNTPSANVEINFQNSMDNKLTSGKGLLFLKEKQVSIKTIRKTMPKAHNATSTLIDNKDKQLQEIVKEEKKEIAAQVEYISEYSSDDRKRKILSKKLQEAKFIIKNESAANKVGVVNQTTESATTQSQLQEKITPFPQPMLVDPVQLERETEQYYKEVSSVGGLANSQSTKSKTKCLTPYQIAQIAKNYPASHGDDEASREMQAAWSTLHQYWTHVQENPYDFDGWTYLLNHVESMNNIEAARSAFEGFLPLYPYCFAYWNKLADLELKFSDYDQCLGILFCGAKSVPFCTDLWANLLKKFEEYSNKEKISDDTVRGLYEYAIDNAGLSWHSYPIWELYIEYETKKENLVRVLDISRRLLAVPTKLYNKNWDQTLALIRDHHPRNFLTVGEYYRLKKRVCEILKVTFNPPPLVPPKHLLKLPQPEDKVLSTMKELIVADIIPIHEANEKEVNKRWKCEEKIKRPYFHVKPLEKKQLKTWKEYLDLEIRNGDPVRICSLFERCLVPCAQYEEFWRRYASYMEDHVLNVLNSKYAGVNYKAGVFASNDTSGNCKDKIVDDVSCGDKNGSLKSDLKQKTKVEQLGEIGEKFSISMPLSAKSIADDKDLKIDADISSPDMWDSDDKKVVGITREIKFEVSFLLNRLSEGISVGGKVLTSPSLTPSSILQGVTWDDVRQIYRRGAWIHCPSKPMLLMQWAEFEESQGNVQTAKELLNTVISKNPSILKARFQLIDLERRSDQYDHVEELYAQAFAAFKEPRIKSFIAIRYARFLFKIKEEDEKALVILRKARKKDKANIHLYHHVFDICYQRRPIDCDGVRAAVTLALGSNMSLEEKFWFCIKRSDFIREHGTMAQLKEAQIEEIEVKKKFELENSSKTKVENDSVKMDSETIEDKEAKDEIKNSSKSTNSKGEKELQSLLPPENVTKPTPVLEPPQMLIDIINRSEEKNKPTEIKEKKSRKRSRSPHHHHRSSKRSRSSRKERDGSRERGEIREKGEIREHKRRSKKAREDRGDKEQDRERHSSSNSKQSKDTSSAFQEILYAPDGTVLYNPNEGSTADPLPNQSLGQDPTNMPPMSGYPMPGQMMPPNYHNYPGQHMQGGYPNQPPMMNYPNMQQPMQGLGNDKNYNNMPPTWDLDSPSLPNYGYGASNNIVKDNQNSMYNRYYDLLNQGYKNKDTKDEPNTYHNMNVQDISGSGPGRNPNTYLPPPPIPQGILGDSLFNQGSVSNMNRPFGRGDLTNPSFDHSSRPPPFGPLLPNPSGPANQYGRQDGYSAPYHMSGPPPLMSLPVQYQPGPSNQFHDSAQHQHQFNDNMTNHNPHTNAPLEHESNFVSSPSKSNNMNIVPSLTGGMSNVNQQEGPPHEDMRNVLNVTSLLKEQRAKGTSNNLPDEPNNVPSGRNTINVQALMKERKLSENSNTNTQGEDIKVGSSGRNTVNVQALMKDKMMSENSNIQEDETIIVSSGRNTIDVRALLKDRRQSEESSQQKDESLAASLGRKENESSSIQIEDSDDDNDSSVKVVSSGRNTINVLALMKGGKLPASVSNPPQNEQKMKDDPRNISRRNNSRMRHRLGGAPTNAENIPPLMEGNNVATNMIGKMQFSIGMGPQRSIPPSSANLDCNVPDWIINEGGELRLSSSANGISLLRYWPRYMNEQGHKTLFQSLRKSVKWFQRRHIIVNAPGKPEQWTILPKLISWVGPCDFEKDGIILNANTNWPPEIVDLLHRLNHFSNSSFNSCFLSLYTNGYAHHPWHTETHTALEKNPTIATISLGVARQLEMKRIDGPEHIRLPLFPGSLCVLEGAAAEDWHCQITKEPEVVQERISLAFRTMLMIKGVTV